jgi:hypothetical protein
MNFYPEKTPRHVGRERPLWQNYQQASLFDARFRVKGGIFHSFGIMRKAMNRCFPIVYFERGVYR